jgi:hypothetical protein
MRRSIGMPESGGRGAPGVVATASTSARRVGTSRRHAYCPLCGHGRAEIAVNDVRTPEDALCPGRCAAAWHALATLRLRESLSERVAARRREEYENQEPHASPLSELLLQRWRAGDWTVAPEVVLLLVQPVERAASEAEEEGLCASPD